MRAPILAFALVVCSLTAQHRVDSRQIHERLIAVVPMIGAGTFADPRRPLFTPAQMAEPSSSGIIAFHAEVSDDGRYAVVEFVARDRAAFGQILADARVLEKFEKGRSKRGDVEAALKKYKKNLKLENFGVAAQ